MNLPANNPLGTNKVPRYVRQRLASVAAQLGLEECELTA